MAKQNWNKTLLDKEKAWETRALQALRIDPPTYWMFPSDDLSTEQPWYRCTCFPAAYPAKLLCYFNYSRGCKATKFNLIRAIIYFPWCFRSQTGIGVHSRKHGMNCLQENECLLNNNITFIRNLLIVFYQEGSGETFFRVCFVIN